MPTDIVIPTVGESINSGVLAKWLKADHATEAKTADAMWKKISGESGRTSEEPRSDH